MSLLLPFDPETLGAPEASSPPPERIVSGQPRHLTWNVETTPDEALFAGMWESSPGAWRVEYDEWEFCSIVSGVSILREDGEAPKTVQAGDSFVLRPGFRGVWEVVETTRKLYVIRLP